MTTSQLIRKIKELKGVKPNQDWVLLTKKQILGEEVTPELFPFLRPAYAGLFALFLLLGLFEFSQGALPGESLYYFKKIVERGQIIISSEEARPSFNLELANKRLEELNEIALGNEAKKLAPAMHEFQIKVAEAAENLTKVKKINKEIVFQTQKLEENKEKVEKVLAAKIDTDDYDTALSQLVESQILDLEQRTLSEEDQEILEAVRQDFESGNYSEALIGILDLSQNDL
ncbi:MAG: DUF5667 domain-containing protein [Patescibacteria group bacterium]|nr:DUF5667 domain-containing protein [Patescibacteria group bacterium]